MYSLTLENAVGNVLTFNELGGPFSITEIQGLNPPEATINLSEVALVDGAQYNGSKLNYRTINLAFAIEYNAEANRMAMYNVLRTKQKIRLYYTSDYLDVFIDGYVASIDITYFDMKQIVTTQILCPSPYLKNAQQVVNELSAIIDAFHFWFASTEDPQIVFGYFDEYAEVFIENLGNIETGLTIELYARNTVVNPKIYNYSSQEFIGLNFTMEAGDTITINTEKGSKSVTLLRDGVESNIFNYLMQNITWLQLDPDGDTFVFETTSGQNYLDITFNHNNLYEGV